MKFNSLYILILVFAIFSLVFIACHKEDHDNVKPTVRILQPNRGDTLYLNETSLFKSEFWDDKGLSSYFIQISNPNIADKNRVVLNKDSTLRGDSVIYLNEIIQRSDIFNVDSIITIENAFILDTIGYYNSSRGPFAVKDGIYQFKVVVMDKAGNRDSSFFDINVAYRH